MSSLPRPYSDKYVAGSGDYDLYKNKNVDFMSSGPLPKVFYAILVLMLWFSIHITGTFSPEDCWTVVNMVHGVVTFVMFHWIKGCPDDSTQGEYNGFTLYEQLDAGVPWTSSKKFLMLMPTLITWMACYIADYKPIYIVVNCGMFLISIIAKIPEMHRVRIFGINSTAGIDTAVGMEHTTSPARRNSTTSRQGRKTR